jgi:predicted nucleic acid-binding protein
LLDTNVAIHLRDGDEATLARFAALEEKPFLSAITRVELEGGIFVRPELAEKRRAALDAMLGLLPVIDFDAEMAEAYGAILASTGFSRRKIIDRMIAATALVEGMTLITCNGGDFSDVPGLQMVVWQVPA